MKQKKNPVMRSMMLARLRNIIGLLFQQKLITPEKKKKKKKKKMMMMMKEEEEGGGGGAKQQQQQQQQQPKSNKTPAAILFGIRRVGQSIRFPFFFAIPSKRKRHIYDA